MIDFPWGKRPSTVPEVGDHVNVAVYGGVGYRPGRILAVSPRGSRIRVSMLDPKIQSSDGVLEQGDSIQVRYDPAELPKRSVRVSFVLPWDGKRYYRVGLASVESSKPQYLGRHPLR